MRGQHTYAVMIMAVVVASISGAGQPRVTLRQQLTVSDTLRHLLPPAYSTPGFGYPLRVVITDLARFRRLWIEEVGADTVAQPLPKVDFTKDEVIVAALGRQSGTGSSIRIESTVAHDSWTDVNVMVSHGGRLCVEGGAFVRPVDLVVLPKVREDFVVFHDRLVIHDCK